ncbi:MAG: WYL domain-containing protein, partial [Mycobacteriales bacterium]
EAQSRSASSKNFELLAHLNRKLNDAELELLADAVDRNADVVIVYTDSNGTTSARAVRPHHVYGKWLDAWCHLRNAQRDFTVAKIKAVAPLG